jgi:hypothetical protein
LKQSALLGKAASQKILAGLTFTHFAEQRFHVVEILFQRATAGRG